MIYFTADLHLGHRKIIDFERGEKFSSVPEHDKYVISLLSEHLHDDDILYLLGDVGDNEGVNALRNVRGKKILILGNHDHNSISFYKEVFDEVYDHPIFYSKRLLLSHHPQMTDRDVLNLHGHLHSSVLDLDNYWNMNIHMCNYRLISMKDVEKKISQIPIDTNKYKFKQEWWIRHQYYEKAPSDLVVKDGYIVL